MLPRTHLLAPCLPPACQLVLGAFGNTCVLPARILLHATRTLLRPCAHCLPPSQLGFWNFAAVHFIPCAHLLTAQLAYAPTHYDDVLERCVTCYNSPYQMRPAQRVVCNVLNCVLRFVQHQHTHQHVALYLLDCSTISAGFVMQLHVHPHELLGCDTTGLTTMLFHWSLFQYIRSRFAVALHIVKVAIHVLLSTRRAPKRCSQTSSRLLQNSS
jgi:hypothetical protein